MKRILFETLLLAGIASNCAGQTPAIATDITLTSSRPNLQCGSGYQGSDCQLLTGILRLNLNQLRLTIPGWRWVVVSRSRWDEVAKSFGVDPEVPAFSSLGIHTTYLDDSLFTMQASANERLQSFSSRGGYDRLRWVIAHESGHILCNTSDERKAAKAAGRLEFGSGKLCR
jgi:hypothetical protein